MTGPIPHVDGSLFQPHNWNGDFCRKFHYMDCQKEAIRDRIIGWCRASELVSRPDNDYDYVAILLDDESWCHFPTVYLELESDRAFWSFEGFKLKKLSQKQGRETVHA